ncbi:hypothetical protein BDV96DRAFT_221164 [Lophiotrema nucula]|uniref:Uncharacterized protein n=1 Tax=Lophiotrema nucula TaxID=690887 RepID=A0A6A5YSE7_9PLEO|nr:hypothetical protein BDV96DRAFT_221164 [Lophiotrema nucula]
MADNNIPRLDLDSQVQESGAPPRESLFEPGGTQPQPVRPAPSESEPVSEPAPEPEPEPEPGYDALSGDWRRNLPPPSFPLARSAPASDSASRSDREYLEPPSPDADLYSKDFEGTWKDRFGADDNAAESEASTASDTSGQGSSLQKVPTRRPQPDRPSKPQGTPPPSLIATVGDARWFSYHYNQHNQMQKWDDERQIFVPRDNVRWPLPSWNEATSGDLGWVFGLNPLEYERW